MSRDTTPGYSISRGVKVIAVLSLLLIIASIISMNLGKVRLNPMEVMNVLFGNGTDQHNLIVYRFRLPRIVLSIVVGIGMATSGCILQGILRNDLASPDVMGISAGSGFCMLIYVAAFTTAGAYSAIALPSLAFAGGLIAAIIIYVLSYRRSRNVSSVKVLLTGVAINIGFSALSLFFTLRLNRQQYEFAEHWLAGSLWGDEWHFIAILAVWNAVLLILVLYKARVLDALNLGVPIATGLGVNYNRQFMILAIAAVALASGSVALGGAFFFVGIIAPHIARRLVGPNHKLLVPASALFGALIMVVSESIARVVSFGSGVPTGIVVTLVSAPYFIYLLVRSSKIGI